MAASDGVVIIGAGIIGLATVYYLTELKDTPAPSIHLVEASPELFASASGFGPATASLGVLSFKLHRELAEKHDGRNRWGYSRSTGTSLTHDGRLNGARGDDWLRDDGSRAQSAAEHDFSGPSNAPAWLTRRAGDALDIISSVDTTGQVDPLRLCQFLLQELVSKGVKLHQPSRVVKISREASNINGVIVENVSTKHTETLSCDRVVITAGAWSGRVFGELFPDSDLNLHVGQLAGHSVVVKSPRWTAQHETDGCHAVFTTLRSGFSPEIFSRVGGEIYIAGLNDPDLALPELATDAVPDHACIQELVQVSQRFLGQDGTDVSDLEVVRQGLCFRPITTSGVPIVSRIDPRRLGPAYTGQQHGGVFVSTGHGPWGISHSLGTGKVMAELIESRTTSADVMHLRL
ncbi:hypothetical protein AMS68_000095 [Peltaster fructicola]|uniref:FAD dependent oxidoreductase domain-containing protein n=1 Tax=Peltaster fructicola TaxID=286661 RepID=A0A6H0XIV5_9PEZI|nr:hypothetical protein AMS68_000095 [Peltaster fructicola]